jgi:hypothetical protein
MISSLPPDRAEASAAANRRRWPPARPTSQAVDE